MLSAWMDQTNTLTLMLLRLTSTRSGSFLFILSRVSSTSVELGSSSGTGLYWVHWITPVTHLNNTLSCTAGDRYCYISLTVSHNIHLKHVCGRFHTRLYWEFILYFSGHQWTVDCFRLIFLQSLPNKVVMKFLWRSFLTVGNPSLWTQGFIIACSTDWSINLHKKRFYHLSILDLCFHSSRCDAESDGLHNPGKKSLDMDGVALKINIKPKVYFWKLAVTEHVKMQIVQVYWSDKCVFYFLASVNYVVYLKFSHKIMLYQHYGGYFYFLCGIS